MKFKGILSIILIGITGYALYMIIPPAFFKKNVKMTITFETPNGDISGYAVREISNEGTHSTVDWPGGNPAKVRGESVVIDFGDGKKIFTLINGEDSRFYEAFPPPGGHPQSNEAMDYFASLPVGMSAVVEKSEWLRFVMFTNIDDPTSVILLHGGKFNSKTQGYDHVNRFEEILGTGVQLKDVTIEITDEPVTWKIENDLHYILEQFDGGYLGKTRKERIKTYNLHAGYFIMGKEK